MKNRTLKKFITAALAATMIVTGTGITGSGIGGAVTSQAEQEMDYRVNVYSYSSKGSIKSTSISSYNIDMKPGEALPTRQLKLPSKVNKPVSNAKFKGWYVSYYYDSPSGYQTSEDIALDKFRLPKYSQIRTTEASVYVFPKFDRMKYSSYNVNTCGDSFEKSKYGNYGLGKISMKKAYTDKQLIAIAKTKATDKKYGKLTWHVVRRGLDKVTVFSSSKKVKLTVYYEYYDKSSIRHYVNRQMYIAPGSSKVRSILTYKPSSLTPYFKNFYNTYGSSLKAAEKSIHETLRNDAYNGNDTTLDLIAEYSRNYKAVITTEPGVKRAKDPYAVGEYYYQYPTAGYQPHAVFFKGNSIKVSAANASIKKFKRSVTVKGLQYKGYSGAYRIGDKYIRNKYVGKAKPLSAKSKITGEETVYANQKFSGCYVASLIYRRGKNKYGDLVYADDKNTDLYQKVYRNGAKITKPAATSRRYKNIKNWQLLTIKSDGSREWNYSFNPSKTQLVAKDGYSYYIFGNGVRK